MSGQGIEVALSLAERIAYAYAESVDGEHGCCHDIAALRAGGWAPEFDDDEFYPLPPDCAGRAKLDEWLPQIEALQERCSR